MVDVVSPKVDTSGNSPAGHDQAMAAKVDKVEALLKQQQEQVQPQETVKLAGKFTSQEELERAYLELEKKLGQPRQAQQTPQKQKPQVDPTKVDDKQAADIAKNAGLDINQMQSYFEQNGELSADHYAALEKVGIPKPVVDQYIAGLQAQAEQYRTSLIAKVGGQERFEAMADWAKVNLSDAELAAYNRAVASNDLTVVENAVLGLAFRYQSEVGKDPKLLGGSNSGASVFQSVAQLVEAMKDPRYEKDPAYRKEVRDKLARSNIM